MLLPSQPLPSSPNDTARIASAALGCGDLYVLLTEKLGAVFANVGSSGLDFGCLAAWFA